MIKLNIQAITETGLCVHFRNCRQSGISSVNNYKACLNFEHTETDSIIISTEKHDCKWMFLQEDCATIRRYGHVHNTMSCVIDNKNYLWLIIEYKEKFYQIIQCNGEYIELNII